MPETTYSSVALGNKCETMKRHDKLRETKLALGDAKMLGQVAIEVLHKHSPEHQSANTQTTTRHLGKGIEALSV